MSKPVHAQLGKAAATAISASPHPHPTSATCGAAGRSAGGRLELSVGRPGHLGHLWVILLKPWHRDCPRRQETKAPASVHMRPAECQARWPPSQALPPTWQPASSCSFMPGRAQSEGTSAWRAHTPCRGWRRGNRGQTLGRCCGPGFHLQLLEGPGRRQPQSKLGCVPSAAAAFAGVRRRAPLTSSRHTPHVTAGSTSS